MTETTPTHIWCDSCGGIVPLKPQEASALDISGKFSGYDMTCERGHVVATVFTEAA